MLVELAIRDGPDSGRSIVLEGYRAFVLGRARPPNPHTPLILDPYLSRFHTLVVFDGFTASVEDLGSQNGTLVDGKRVERAELRQGATLRVGQTTIGVEYHATDESGFGAAGPASLPSLEGRTLGGYELLERVRAGVPEVHHARRREDLRPATLLALPRSPRDTGEAVTRFLRGIERHTGIEHPGVAAAREAGGAEDCLWVATELALGETIAEFVDRLGPRPPDEVIGLGRELLDALAAVHARNLVHGAIRPGNVLIEVRDGKPVPHLTEVGLVRSLRGWRSGSLTAAGRLADDPAWTAREQLYDSRGVSPASDVFSLGACLHLALTGRGPRDGADGRALVRALSDAPPPLRETAPDVPPRLAEWLDRALLRDPAERYGGAEEMLFALDG